MQLIYRILIEFRRDLILGVFAIAGTLLLVGPSLALETIAREAVLIETATGKVLFEKNADRPMPPASMSKIMT